MATPGTPPNNPAGERPAFAVLRQDEDWSALRDPRLRIGAWDRLKYVPVNARGSMSLSLAADAYVSARGFENAGLGASPGFDDTYNTRLNVHAALTLGDRLRLYGALKHGGQYRKEGLVVQRAVREPGHEAVNRVGAPGETAAAQLGDECPHVALARGLARRHVLDVRSEARGDPRAARARRALGEVPARSHVRTVPRPRFNRPQISTCGTPASRTATACSYRASRAARRRSIAPADARGQTASRTASLCGSGRRPESPLALRRTRRRSRGRHGRG